VPVPRRSEVFGVLEFFSRETRPSDAYLLRAMTTIGVQVGHFIDRVTAEEALAHQALHDSLTGLPNRAYLADRLSEALTAAEASGSTAALLLLDLNRFKEVNDTLGHHYGDMVLREVSARVQSVVRGSATLARLGGDEFAVVLPSADFTMAIKVARTILAMLDMPYELEEHSIDVGASLGISLYPEHGGEPSELLRRADVAMYIAKDTGGGYEIYSVAKDRHSVRRLTLAADLRLALANDDLRLHFQPLLALPEGKIKGVEVLVRWQHPERGLIMPEQFIPLAETTGLIGVLTLWVLEAALRQCAAWHQAGCTFGVSVNVSVRTLQDAQLPDTVAWLLHRYAVAPEMLTLEITESTLMADPLRAMNVLTRMAKIGVRIAIDDFGTGYSSLAYLKGLPIHEIKIDKSFVIGMGKGENDTAIVRSVIELGHNLGMKVVAEGVEHQPAWNILVGMGCDIAQGNFMSVPVPAHELEAWLTRVGHFPGIASG
jgi:diguanylate cyclase (GGDEF)-like protein